MTHVSEVANDPDYIECLDLGFVGLIDHMGSDSAIVKAAQVSYGKGTKKSKDERGLIRYMMRHRHTSPFEMCEVKLHIKCPIFVVRQIVRHRTHNMNEYSGRYSIMTDEFYIPDSDALLPQSTTNKQGRSGTLTDLQKMTYQQIIKDHSDTSYARYQDLLGEETEDDPGIARELARMVLPLNIYTEFYWKQNLHNLLHLLGLRLDSHAQMEIRVYAQAIYDTIKPLYPIAVAAWEDYANNAYTLSRMEVDIVKSIFKMEKTANIRALCKAEDMSVREIDEFMAKFTSTQV